MHFDDRLTTVLAGDVPGGAAAVAQYRQLVDILGQIGASAADERHALGLARIHSLRSAVSESDRLLTVQCLSGRLVSPVLVQYLAAETPQIASAAIRAARLTDGQWAALVPALPTRARGFLRHRRDLGARTRALLDQLGLYDTALPDAVAQVAVAAPEAPIGVAEPIVSEPVPTADLPSADVISTEPTAEAAAPIADALQPDEPLPIEALASVANVATAPESGGPQSIGEIVKRIEALQEVRFKQAMEDRPATAVPDWNRLGHAVQGDAIQADAITGDAMSRDATQDDDRSAADEPLAVAPESVTPEEFRFSTGVDGAIASASGVALGAVYGLSLALPAMAGFRGVDAAVATAFSRRMPVRGGRANLGGAAGLSGEWRI
ncbi:MAG: hypothetical protein ACT6SC_13540, partial [Blastomonas fulva]